MSFNLKRYKYSRRGEEPSEVFTRPFFRERDVYDTTRLPNDGKGYKHTTMMSEGMPGEPGDIAAPSGGSRTRDGSPEPDDYSRYNPDGREDSQDAKNKLPSDTEPDQPFGNGSGSQYNEGTQTDYGTAGHEGTNREPSDSPMSIERTVERKLGPGGELDRKPTITEMPKKNPFNKSLNNDDTPLRRVRRLQRR